MLAAAIPVILTATVVGILLGTRSHRPALSFTSASDATFTVGIFQQFPISANLSDAEFAVRGEIPEGLRVEPVTGGGAMIVGTPASGTGRDYEFQLIASSEGDTTARVVRLTVLETGLVTSPEAVTTAIGTKFSFEVTTSGFPPSSLDISDGIPVGVSFKDNGDGTGTISGKPANDTSGLHVFHLTATNVAGTTTTELQLIVTEKPSFTSKDSVALWPWSDLNHQITTTGYPAPALTMSGELPSGLQFRDNGDGTGTIWGDPRFNWHWDPHDYYETYRVSLTATNDAGHVVQTFSISLRVD